jgi:putative transcriptional regulator
VPPRLRTVLALALASVVAVMAVMWTMRGKEDGRAQGPPAHGLTGQFIVATPAMADSRFAKSVIYIVADEEDGAMGLIVNRIVGSGPMKSLLAGFGVPSENENSTVTLYYGGPVEPRRGFVLHSAEYTGPDTRVVAGDIAISTGLDVLRAMATRQGPQHSRVMLGYAGWGPGQLDGEIARGDWLTASARAPLVFDDDAGTLWERVYKQAGRAL